MLFVGIFFSLCDAVDVLCVNAVIRRVYRAKKKEETSAPLVRNWL